MGLLDADIYGPSQPQMMGLAGLKPQSTDGKHITPLRVHGVEVMSIGFMIDAEQPMAWRGPDGDPGAHAAVGGYQLG